MIKAPKLVAQDVWYAYPEGDWVLKGASLEVAPGDFLALIGENGSGKTTLAKHLNGLLRPSKGLVSHNGNNILKYSTGKLARQVGYVFQNPDHMLFSPTVFQEIASGPRYLGFSETEIEATARKTLQQFGLADVAERGPASLDFGTRRMVSIAAVVAARPKVVILDEPTLGLDWGKATSLMDRLRSLHHDGHTVMLITHDMRLVGEYAHKVALMRDGVLVAVGEPSQILHSLADSHIRPPQIMQLAQLLGMTQSTVEAVCEAIAEQVVHPHD